jgi:hypothetical protein
LLYDKFSRSGLMYCLTRLLYQFSTTAEIQTLVEHEHEASLAITLIVPADLQISYICLPAMYVNQDNPLKVSPEIYTPLPHVSALGSIGFFNTMMIYN